MKKLVINIFAKKYILPLIEFSINDFTQRTEVRSNVQYRTLMVKIDTKGRRSSSVDYNFNG